jgi:hypothetical protein
VEYSLSKVSSVKDKEEIVIGREDVNEKEELLEL